MTMERRDFFDRIMSAALPKRLYPFYSRNRELMLYLLFGGLAFFISIATFAFFDTLLGMNELIANVLSWIITVLFAFVTNRKWVFSSARDGSGFFAQMARFYVGRIFTLIVEEAILYVFITRMGCGSIAVKVIAQIVVIVLNYAVSKLWIFRAKRD